MYEIKKGKVYCGEELISLKTLIERLDKAEDKIVNIKNMYSKHKIVEMSAKLRTLADLLDKVPHMTGEAQKNLHMVANTLSKTGQILEL